MNGANTVPRGALVIAGGLVLFTLAATAAVRVTGAPPSASPSLVRAEEGARPVATRLLGFADRADGAVVITDLTTRKVVQTIEPGGETGFVRGVMRGLARDRKMRGIGNAPGFELTLWGNGQLSLTDTATKRELELGGFGGTNRAAFASLLESST
jgi:putative photosynthetic complex assembly protein